MFEAIIGQLYPTIFIALLVGGISISARGGSLVVGQFHGALDSL